MGARLGNLWDDVSSSLWFVPAILVLAAVLLSYLLLWVDQSLFPDLGDRVPVIFGGTPDAAREILAVIAGSLITVVAVAFTVTLVAVQQAASQFSPRLLRNFTSDRGNQVVLGAYIATFAYALLVMRQVRSSGDGQEEFVPALSLFVGILLALVSLGLLIYFIHHIVQSLQITSIINGVRREMAGEISTMFPASLGRPVADGPVFESLGSDTRHFEAPYQAPITSSKQGYLRRLNEDDLESLANDTLRLVVVSPRIGQYIPRGYEIARVWSDAPPDEEKVEQVHKAFILSPSRTLKQDPLFGVAQLVDIALRALSPGVNDPTTAEQCIDELGDVLGDLAQRDFPSPIRQLNHHAYLMVNRPSFGDFVDAAFSQIRRTSQGNVHVTLHLLLALQKIVGRVTSPVRAQAISLQVTEVLAALESSQMTDADLRLVRQAAMAVLDVLRDQVADPR